MKKILRKIVLKIVIEWQQIKMLMLSKKLYASCDELPKWNFDKILQTNDLKYLIVGYEYGDIEVPENAQKVWEAILEEYNEKIANNKILQFYEMIIDVDELENRAYYGPILLNQIIYRGGEMPKKMREEYIQLLSQYGFKINKEKSLKEEVERLSKQFKVVNMKIETKSKEINDFKEKNFSNNTTTAEIKIKIYKICKVDLDLKRTTVSEWLLWIEEAIKTAA